MLLVQSHFRLALALTLLLGLLPAWTAAQAQQGCSHSCTTAIGCHGGCSVDAGGSCSAICAGGACSYRCRLLGPGCEGGESGSCDFQPPPEGTGIGEVKPVDWAVLEYWTDGVGMMGSDDVAPIAASSAGFARWAADEYREKVNESTSTLVRGVREQGEAVTPGPRQRRRTLYLAPRLAPCVEFEHRLRSHALPFDVEPGAKMYFRGRTDPAGSVVEVETLYSTLPESNPGLHSFIAGNLDVWTTPARPLEFFGYVLADAGREASFIIAGAIEKPGTY